jgi:putative transcriptional regulator
VFVKGRLDLLDCVRGTLASAGYAVSERCAIRPVSFDVVARRDSHLLIVKVLTNIDAFDRRVAEEMKTLARFLEGVPLLVGERSGTGPLEDGVVYFHHAIRALTPTTLSDHVLQDAPPFVYAAPGGLYVNLATQMLKEIRKQRELSLGVLAEVAGVSRRTIQMYEEGMSATVDSALRLEEFLNAHLVEPIDPFRTAPEEAAEPVPSAFDLSAFGDLEREVFRILEEVGFLVVPTGKSPFAALSHQPKNPILTGINEEDRAARRKARIMASISQVTERSGVFVVRKETVRTDLEGTAIVTRSELTRVRDPQELHRLIEERRRRLKAPDE